METSSNKSTATIMHLSTLTQYFIPFGNFIFPIILWSIAKKSSAFVDHHGRQAINFQLSLFLYSVILVVIAVPIFVFTIFKNIPFSEMANGNLIANDFSAANITGIVTVAVTAVVVFFFLKVAEFFLIINAAVKAASGELFYYPLTIKFIRTAPGASISAEATADPETSLTA